MTDLGFLLRAATLVIAAPLTISKRVAIITVALRLIAPGITEARAPGHRPAVGGRRERPAVCRAYSAA
jgi:hypothetical protein